MTTLLFALSLWLLLLMAGYLWDWPVWLVYLGVAIATLGVMALLLLATALQGADSDLAEDRADDWTREQGWK